MLRTESEREYRYALTPDEAVCQMIGYENHELPWDKLLECAIEEAEDNLYEAQQNDAPVREQAFLLEEIDRLENSYSNALSWDSDLHNALEEIDLGMGHPTLELCGTNYADGLPRFTIASLHQWSISSIQRKAPVWAVISSQPSVQVPKPAARISANARQVTDKPVSVVTKNLMVTSRIIAHTLGGLIDRLAEDDHINQLAEGNCINDDDSVNWPALAGYLSSQPETGKSEWTVTSGSQVSMDPKPAEKQELVLAILAENLAHLAEKARVNEWMPFANKAGERDTGAFLKNGHSVPGRIYRHLLRVGAIIEDTPNQGASSIQHKLGDAQKRLLSAGTPSFSAIQLQQALEFADQVYAKRFRLTPPRPAGLPD